MGTTKINFSGAAGLSITNTSVHYSVGEKYNPVSDIYSHVALKFGVHPPEIKYNNIVSANLVLYGTQFLDDNSDEKTILSDNRITKDFDPETATYKSISSERGSSAYIYKSEFPGWITYFVNFKSVMRKYYGLMIAFPKFEFYTPYGLNKPHMLIEYEDTPSGLFAAEISPNEFINQCIDQKISWILEHRAYTFETPEAVSAAIEWRKQGDSVIYSIDAENTGYAIVPAGTFQGDSVDIRVVVKSNSGATTNSVWTNLQLVPPIIDSPAPSSGFVPKKSSSIFSWSIVYVEESEKKQVQQISAVFRWREDELGTIHEVPVSGAATNITIPAGTFSTDSIQWMVLATAIGGVDVASDWMTCTTIDGISTAKALSPKSTVIQSGADITFAWEHIISTGSAPTGYDIQYSTDQILWLDLLSGKTSETTAVLANNTLPGGTVYWHVRTYNTDGLAGAWSDPAEIIVIAPPAVPVITLEQISPRPVIRWTSTDQAAYELEIVDVGSVARYGSENRYQTKSILPDGLHTVRVRIQNRYSQWSAWAEAIFTIFNTPGGSISLSALAAANGDVSLSWSQGAFTGYEVLRDGVVIARTAQAAYTDRWAVGQVQYQVRGIVDAAGNYSLSNAVDLTVEVPTVQIAPVSGGDWLALPYTTTDIREVATSVSRAVTYQQFLGAQLPTATVSEALTISHQLSTALPWSRKADADRLEAMIGQLVCVKDPRGERFVGVLGSYSKTSSRFYLAYSLTITPVDWEEAST